MRYPAIGRYLSLVIAAAVIASCAGSAEVTETPLGYPLIACPATGDGAIPARPGADLVLPGTIAFNYAMWHNKSRSSTTCGAQSVEGAKTTIHPEDLVGDAGIPFVATLQRAIPLQAPDNRRPRLRLFRLDGSGPVQIDEQVLASGPAYRTMGWVLPGAPPGRYRMQILSADGEILADGTFEIVE